MAVDVADCMVGGAYASIVACWTAGADAEPDCGVWLGEGALDGAGGLGDAGGFMSAALGPAGMFVERARAAFSGGGGGVAKPFVSPVIGNCVLQPGHAASFPSKSSGATSVCEQRGQLTEIGIGLRTQLRTLGNSTRRDPR